MKCGVVLLVTRELVAVIQYVLLLQQFQTLLTVTFQVEQYCQPYQKAFW